MSRLSEKYPVEHAMLVAINKAAGGGAFFGNNFIDYRGHHAHVTGHGYLLMHDANYTDTRELHTTGEALEAFELSNSAEGPLLGLDEEGNRG